MAKNLKDNTKTINLLDERICILESRIGALTKTVKSLEKTLYHLEKEVKKDPMLACKERIRDYLQKARKKKAALIPVYTARTNQDLELP